MFSWLTEPAFWRHASVPLAAALAGTMAFLLARRKWRRRRDGVVIAPLARRFFSAGPRRLAGLPEIFSSLDPEQLAEQMLKVLQPRLRRLLDEVMLEQDAGLWRSTPELIRQKICDNIAADLPAAMRAMIREAGEQVAELADYEELVVARLAGDPELYLRLCRQREAGDYCRVLAAEVLDGRAIFQEMFGGRCREATAALLRRHLEPMVYSGVGPFRAGIEMAIGRDKLRAICDWAVAKSGPLALLAFDDWHFHQAGAARVARLLEARLAELPPAEAKAVLAAARPPRALPPWLAALLAALVAGGLMAGFLVGG